MSSRFDRLTLLSTFVRIAERRSLSGAARDLGTSQPSVSRQLAALEDRLGTVLVRRTTHDVTLTPDGLALLADARRMLGEWEAIEDRHSGQGGLRGTIRVIAPVGLGQRLLLRAAAEFMHAHPQITIDWRLRDDVIRFAEEGCDCWIKIGAVPDDTLVVRQLAKVERLVVGTADCLARQRGADVAKMPWLTLGQFEGNRIELYDTKGAARSFTVRPKMASDNIFAIYEAARQGVGIAILPRWFVAEDLDSGALVDVAPNLRAAQLPVNLALATGTQRPARVERFCRAVQAYCDRWL
ncbi:LysR family transcriptional regulator [Sulfitobacter sp. S190]|uniref:LysR family transcriptional regulator n=1 Tax=Sulfitobacter sp. S190 TaxID=2867022 RepID=UPI0021A67F46|nr:LysR family transcriptional regulator [Sulfitobacter sp. S190]UWR21179.1 LysR family transcriptional regulator [Sulfitobacter sp. S190]